MCVCVCVCICSTCLQTVPDATQLVCLQCDCSFESRNSVLIAVSTWEESVGCGWSQEWIVVGILWVKSADYGQH